MASVETDRTLLFGLLALQNGLIDREQLVAAFQIWTRDKCRQMAEYLVEIGSLDARQCGVIQAMVELHEKKHGGNALESFAVSPGGRSALESFAACGDIEITRALALVGPGPASSQSDADGERDGTYSSGMATRGGQRFCAGLPHTHAVLDSLSDNIAVLDHSGTIVAVNRAWREFAAANGARSADVAEGTNYLATCSVTTGEDAETARTLATGVRDVFAGQREFLELEYPCHSPDQRRWFIARVTPLNGDDQRLVLVAHVDITKRKLAEKAVRDLADRLRVVSRRVVEVQEAERLHIARELHEELGQVLSAINLDLHSVKGVCDAAAWPRIEQCIQNVVQAATRVRELSLDLRPSMLDHLGLATTLRWYADRQAQRAGFTIHFDVESAAIPLPAKLTNACFRVVQEALTNVKRHGRARHVWVALRQTSDMLELAVRDDGVGFEPDTVLNAAARGEGLGLLEMQDRVEQLGGRADIQSQPGRGTSIRIRLPIVDPPPSP